MSTPVRASDRDLRTLARVVSEDRTDLPDGEGVPPSLLADLMGQIRCDILSLDGSRPRAADALVQPGNPVLQRRGRIRGHGRGDLGALLGLPGLQLRCPYP